MNLSEGVRKYLELAGDFGKPVPLSSFGLPKDETEKLFAAWDEDYQINRFMMLTLEAAPAQGAQEAYCVNGFDCTHVTFQPQIKELL